jgi:hypothetical protein
VCVYVYIYIYCFIFASTQIHSLFLELVGAKGLKLEDHFTTASFGLYWD